MSDSTDKPKPRWQPIPAKERRVLGVLVEKAKTTPEQYPLSLSGLRTGCNQKNNRYPLMELEPEEVEAALDHLRTLGAVAEIQGQGRVAKYRHYAYEWLGVEKAEAAVMTELLLRGTQTEGELRGRAARMADIPDLAALRPVLESLKAKGLVISLTPQGRGHVVTHGLYEPRELEKQRAEVAAGLVDNGSAAAGDEPSTETRPHSVTTTGKTSNLELIALRNDVDELREALSGLRSEFEQLKSQLT
jgi:uncharacterized protein YceH (UPF0502 family)